MYKIGFYFDYNRWYIQGIVMWVYLLLPLSIFTFHGDIAYLAYIVSPHGYHTNIAICLFEPNFVSKFTLVNDDTNV